MAQERPRLPALRAAAQGGCVNRAIPVTRANDFSALAATEAAPAGIGEVRLSQRIGYLVLVLIGLALAAGFGHFWFAPGRLPHDFSNGEDVADLVLFCESAERGQVRAGEDSVTQRRGLPGMTIPATPAWETSTSCRYSSGMARGSFSG